MIQNALIVFVAGGTGCVARYLLVLIMPRIDALPLGVLAVNLIGSFAAGLFFGSIHRFSPAQPIVLAAMVGFLGGFTTLSAFSLEFYQLFQKNIWVAAFYLFLSIAGSIALFASGVALLRNALL